ncbi:MULTISPECIES: O-acetyl-ADP-ribose deacetylase [unclassified Gordonia (in: high G+C Gram-positive bacteria)]
MVSIDLVHGDITRQDVDAIVNAANSSLLGGGGVDGAIHRRGGPAILAACRELRATRFPDGLPTGQAVATTAGDLAARWVIHTVGPVYSSRADRSALLESCYRESLRVANELGARSIAFPAISTGVYGWPMVDGARRAVTAVRESDTPIDTVRFVLFDDVAFAAFTDALT